MRMSSWVNVRPQRTKEGQLLGEGMSCSLTMHLSHFHEAQEELLKVVKSTLKRLILHPRRKRDQDPQ